MLSWYQVVPGVFVLLADGIFASPLRVLVNATGEVLEFYKLIGYLLINGTLGECVHGAELPWGIECVVRISFNRSRFGDEVAEFLAKDRDESSKDIKNFPLLVLPEWELGSVDAYLSRSYLKVGAYCSVFAARHYCKS